MSYEITWDNDKAKKNIKKHSITFEEAATVFLDPLRLTFCDEKHSDKEDREITVGHSAKSRLLLVVHTELGIGNEMRIISARKVTPRERRDYEERV